MTRDDPNTIWSRTSVTPCVAEFLGYANHALRIPALPYKESQVGGSPLTVGTVLAAFGLALTPLSQSKLDRMSPIS